MKSIAALVVGVAAVALASAPNAQVAQIHNIYLLPMNNGLDQFLANRLTNLGVFRVVTDPQKADAVLTDRLGESFESRFLELYPESKEEAAAAKKAAPAEAAKPAEATKPAQAAKPAAAAPKKDEKASAAKDEKPDTTAAESLPSFRVGAAPPVPVSTFRRAKGTVFLVDRQDRMVLWSIYLEPKNTTARELHRAAGEIAERLTKVAERLTKEATKKK
ncbi:MAG TPA: hypothetical protein VHA11_07995 [Bryobacteraceae bacterium]|nr:hypothetical protein [Bryobacteraceae bacterium]